MEEGTIFGGSQNNQSQEIESVPIAPVQQPVQPQANNIPPVGPPPPPPFPPIPPDHGDGFLSKINKKVIFLVVLIVVVIFILIFIFLKFSQKEVPAPANVVLSYWGIQEEAVMNPLISDFEKKNPGVKINYENQDLENYREKLNARIPSGKGPDIFTFNSTWFPMVDDLLAPIPGDYISAEDFKNKSYEIVSSDLIRDGKVYGVPLEIDTLVMYVNNDLFKSTASASGEIISPPKTWQEYIVKTRELTTKDETGRIVVSGGAMGTYENIKYSSDIVSLLFLQNNVDLKNPTSSTQKIIDAIKFYSNFSLVENNIWDSTLDNSRIAFSQGKLVMYFGYLKDYQSFKGENPNLNFTIYPVPQLSLDKSSNLINYFVEGVSIESRNKNISFSFIKYLSSNEVQGKIYANKTKNIKQGGLPSDKSLSSGLENAPFELVANQFETSGSMPFLAETKDNGLNQKSSELIKSLIDQNSSGGLSEVQIQEFFTNYNTILDGFRLVSD